MPICTHLSIHILPSQSSLGIAEPGNVKRIREITDQHIAGRNDDLIFVNDTSFCNVITGERVGHQPGI